MGVTGLWRLIEPSGKTVPLETLENKILAVDVSIWLHQAIKGFQDANGAPLPNAHLLGIYHRVCKLLYFRIKPIFVFDGGVPHLKKETISKRNQQKFKKLNEAEQIQKQLLSTLLKHSAVNQVLSESAKAKLISKVTVSKDITNNKTDDNLYKLPPLECDSTLSTEDEFSTSESTDSSPTKYWDLHTIDEKSSYFKSLPVDVKHDILTELKETRKQSSWGKIHELPKQSDDFATFQMKRLLKRYSVQASLEEVEKEMGGRSLSLAELEQLLNDQGVVTASDSLGNRIASDENTKYFLIKDIKKAMHEATIQKEKPMLTKIIETDENKEMVEEHTENVPVDSDTEKTLADKEYESDLQKAIQLSLQEVPSTSGNDLGYTRTQNPSYSFLGDITFHSESESEDDSNTHLNTNQVLMSAKNYMVEYSGLTPSEIDKIMGQNDSKKTNSKIDKNGPKNNTKISSCTKEIVSVSNKESTIDTNSKKEPEKKINESQNIVTTTLSEPDEDKADAIELMSDSNSDVDDLLEVSDKITIDANTKLAKFEILIKPEDKLEDDIFSDIFSTIEKKEHTSNTNINDNNNKIEKTQEQSNIPETTISNREEVQVMETYTKRTQENLNNTEQSIKAKETTNELPESVSSTSSQGFIVEQNQVPKFTTTQLEEMEKQLFMEKEELMTEKFTKERMATNLTDEIYQEAQELLQLFGVPYIVAPMEAEAQCAYLNSINITQGTITDDSDIWLFGGKTVYKNFFDKQKHVMEFEMENIQQFFKLSREQLILLALLVGSDYTVGLQGIGPVTALEVLAAFPIPKTANKENYEALLKGLEQFRNWLLENKPVGLGRTVLKSKLKNVTVSNSFPSLQVLKAYLEPTIDSSEEPFSWAKPDINGLMQFARKKFGWLQTKSEEILKPVLKRLNDSRVQKSIREYFKTKHKIDSEEAVSKLSKRVKIAIKRIEKGPEAVDETVKPKEPRKRNLKRKKDQETRCVSKTKNDACDLSSDEDIKVLREAQERSEGMVQKHEKEVKEEIEARKKKSRTVSDIHKKEVIPQREQDKIDALRSKLKAIEVFRKSKKGPGFVPKRKISSRKPKDDAELSESSSD